MRWHTLETRCVYKILIGKSAEKTPLGRGIVDDDADCIYLAQDRESDRLL
jgi:hypothetical protein